MQASSAPQSLTRKRTRTEFRDQNNQQVRTEVKPRKTQRSKSKNKKRTQSNKRTQKKSLSRQSIISEYFLQKKCKNIQCKVKAKEKDLDLIICELCGDAYHWFCSQQFEEIPESVQEFICTQCQIQYRQFKKLKTSLFDDAQECSHCKKLLNEKKVSIECLKCNLKFHEVCFKKFDDSMFCSSCYKDYLKSADSLFPQQSIMFQAKSKTKGNQSSANIMDYFQQQKHPSAFFPQVQNQTPKDSQLFGQLFSQGMKAPQKRKSMSLSVKRKKHTFKLPKLIDDPMLENEVRDKFKRAFYAKKFKYTTSLVYDSPDCPESKNDPSLEANIQTLPKDNLEAINLLREREKLGILPPLLLQYDPNQGFYVEAAQDLADLTLLCEYLGEVRTYRQCLFNNNDSIMELLETGDSDQSLMIIPEKHANVGRFFNGVNNASKASKKKQNLRSIRCQIDGKVCIFIYTKRQVKKGESLLYDYNGAKSFYPTEDFI